jgi:hypothetical protein
MIKEGIFRKPRLKTNKILKRFAPLFTGDVVNVSASNDSDKNSSFYEYYFGDYDSGNYYRNYFKNANSYHLTNYPDDETEIKTNIQNIPLDLEEELPKELIGRYDVVFNHTVLEHVFDIFTAFKNLCKLSKDIVIVIVPQAQMIHDYRRGYKDYWRFTPFVLDRLFSENGLEILYRDTTKGLSSSMYLFYIASKNPENWDNKFPNLKDVNEYVDYRNNGSLNYLLSFFILKVDGLIRRFRKRK